MKMNTVRSNQKINIDHSIADNQQKNSRPHQFIFLKIGNLPNVELTSCNQNEKKVVNRTVAVLSAFQKLSRHFNRNDRTLKIDTFLNNFLAFE